MNLASFKSNQNIFNAKTLKFGLLSRTIVEKDARQQNFLLWNVFKVNGVEL